MLLENETVDKFGYSIKSLSIGSHKRVCLKCDYCNCEYEATYKNRNNSYKKLPKDACSNCKYLKNKEKNGNPFSKPEIQEKIKQTNLERYGAEWQVQSKNFKEKTKKTCLERYGAESYSASDEGKSNFKNTMFQKYGVSNPSNVEEFCKKREQTFINKYNSKSFYGSEECKQRIKEKYSIDNVFQLEEVKEKSKETNIEKYGVENWMQNPENSKISSEKSLQAKIQKGSVITIEGVLLSEYLEKSKASKSHFYKLYHNLGLEECINYEPKRTLIERVISSIVNSLGVEFEEQRKFNNYISDFSIESKKIIIEANGNYWHSDKFLTRSYHKNKREYYIKQGYFPLFFTEDEILNKPNIVESIIKNKLGMSERVYARKTNIIQVDKKEAKQFLQENHLMGPGSGTSYGLTYNKQLLLLLQIKKIRDGHEISRLCSKNGFNIVGGFSKLLKHINLDKIKTFVDLRYGSGDHLLDLGFKEVSNNLSFHWTDGNIRFHRMKFPGDSGYDLGLVKIWDCGQKCFVKE